MFKWFCAKKRNADWFRHICVVLLLIIGNNEIFWHWIYSKLFLVFQIISIKLIIMIIVIDIDSHDADWHSLLGSIYGSICVYDLSVSIRYACDTFIIQLLPCVALQFFLVTIDTSLSRGRLLSLSKRCTFGTCDRTETTDQFEQSNWETKVLRDAKCVCFFLLV